MPVIDHYRNILTVLIEFDSTPEEVENQLSQLKTFTNEVVKLQPGFISANLHVSTDNQKIVNYAQWKSEEDFQNFLDNQEIQKTIKEILKSKPRFTKMKVVFTS